MGILELAGAEARLVSRLSGTFGFAQGRLKTEVVPFPSVLELERFGLLGRNSRQSGKEASQTRDRCVAKDATLRAARPDPSVAKAATSG